MKGILGRPPSSSEQVSSEIRPDCSELAAGKLSKDGERLHNLSGQPAPCLSCLTVKKLFFTSSLNFSFQFTPVVSCPPTVHHFEQPGSLYLLIFWQVLRGCCSVPQVISFSRLNKASSLSLYSQSRCFSPQLSSWFLCHCSSLLVLFFYHRTQNWTWYSRLSLTNRIKRNNLFLCSAAMLLLMQPRRLLLFLSARARCLLTFTSLSAKESRVPFQRAAAPQLLHAQPVSLWGFLSRCRHLHLSLLDFMLPRSSMLSGSLWMSVVLFSILPGHSSLVSSAHLMTV